MLCAHKIQTNPINPTSPINPTNPINPEPNHHQYALVGTNPINPVNPEPNHHQYALVGAERVPLCKKIYNIYQIIIIILINLSYARKKCVIIICLNFFILQRIHWENVVGKFFKFLFTFRTPGMSLNFILSLNFCDRRPAQK